MSCSIALVMSGTAMLSGATLNVGELRTEREEPQSHLDEGREHSHGNSDCAADHDNDEVAGEDGAKAGVQAQKRQYPGSDPA